MEYDVHKCGYKKQIHQDKVNNAMVEVIRHIVQNSQFDTAIKKKKERLGNQIDRLDETDKHREEKYNDMQNRIESWYYEIAELNASLYTVQMQMQGIREEQIQRQTLCGDAGCFSRLLFVDEIIELICYTIKKNRK